MNIFGFIFEKKKKFGPKIPKYLFVSFKKKTKCSESNKNVNVAFFCVVVQSKSYLRHWKTYFTLILKFCLDYLKETKQENY